MNKFPQLMSVQKFIENLSESENSFLGINKLYALIKRDDFPAIKIGGRYYILVDKFSDWLDQQMNSKSECKKNDEKDQLGGYFYE